MPATKQDWIPSSSAQHSLGLKMCLCVQSAGTAHSLAKTVQESSQLHLESFLQTPEAIAEDWRDSKLAASLSTECPAINSKHLSVPVLATLRCKLMGFKHPALRKITAMDESDSINQASASGATRFTNRRNSWIRHKPRRLKSGQQLGQWPQLVLLFSDREIRLSKMIHWRAGNVT